MNIRAQYCSARTALALLIGSTICWGAEKKGGFTLTSAVPADVFMCVAERHNPSRAFLDDYWGDIFSALHDFGLGSDLMELISSLISQEDMAEVNRLKERASKLCGAVDWKQLFGTEMVFAERLPRVVVRGKNISIGPPDFVWLFRTGGDRAAENYEGLVSIANAIAEEVNKAVGTDVLQVDKTPRQGCKSCCLNVIGHDPKTPRFSVGLALHDDVVVIAVGNEILTDVLELLNGKGTKKAISDDSRFKASFAKLPQAEDALFFFDMHGMLASFQRMMDTTFRALSHNQIVNARFNDEASALNAKAIEAYYENDYKLALDLIKQAHKIAPTDSLVMYNLSCFHALGGDAQEALKWLERSVDGGFYSPKQISTDPDLKIIRHHDRYKAALAKATEKAAEAGHDKKARTVKRVIERVINAAGIIDHIASVEYTEGYSTRCDAITVLSTDASQNPLYPIFARQASLTGFDRYLPKETVSFSVGNGLDLLKLYGFIEDSFSSAGADGEHAWAYWKGIQETFGLDLRKDVLSWIDGGNISITLGESADPAKVWMIKVNDEALAREKVASALTFLSDYLKELATQNPMLGMLTLRTESSTHEALKGFKRLYLPMLPNPGVCGVKDGFLILGTSQEAVALCLATAAGEHPNIRKNARVMAEALMPNAAVQSIKFTDRRKLGTEWAEVVQAVTMVGGMGSMMIPNPKVQQTVGKIVGMLGKLGPVARKIDFYKSTASYTTSNGRIWYTRSVTHYKSPAERNPAGEP